MFIAIDEDGEFVDVDDAVKGNKYYCPSCYEEVIIRDGEINAKHFAHNNSKCKDRWHYDMSEWHRKMQSYFPLENREVVVKNNEEIHRADVLVGNTVIEFQHSPISPAEFEERTVFFRKLEYRVVWVFDVNDQFERGYIYHPEDNDRRLLCWSYPSKCFSRGAWPSDYDKKFAIWFDFGGDLNKIIWCKTDLYGAPDFSRFIYSYRYLNYGEIINVDKFFYSRDDYYEFELEKIRKEHDFTLKYRGTKGMSAKSYICPRTGTFGLSISGETGCSYCKYCCLIAEKVRGRNKEYVIHCCYPKQVRELGSWHDGYECCSCKTIEI